ncbi:MAG: RHS repeat-associated core domain-containing protein [Vicinamibacterales bacterium]
MVTSIRTATSRTSSTGDRRRACREPLRRLIAALVVTVGWFAAAPPEVAAQGPAGTVEYYATDTVGSVRVVFTPAGAVSARADYTPFGDEFNVDPLFARIRFGGQEADAEAGFDYFNARFLQARVGRFSTVDPVLAALPADPQSWNRYAYALSSPLSLTDPSGATVSGDISLPVPGSSSYFDFWLNQQWLGEFGLSPGDGAGERLARKDWADYLAGMSYPSQGGQEQAQPAPHEQEPEVLCPGCLPRPYDPARDAVTDETFEIVSYLVPAGGEVKAASTVGLFAVRGAKLAFSKMTKHAIVERIIGRGISPNAILDALRNPLLIKQVIYDDFGRPTQEVVGRYATLVINGAEERLVTVWRTGRRTVRRLTGS